MARRQSEAVPIVRHENEFGMHDVPRYRNTKDTKVPRCKESGETSCLRKRHWQHTSDQEVPLSQLYTPLAAGGPRQYGLPTVAGHMKTDLA